MKSGTYGELNHELNQRETEKRDYDVILKILKKYKITVKIIESRLEFALRRIKELKKAIEKVQENCRQHNWLATEDEKIVKCTKCKVEKHRSKVKQNIAEYKEEKEEVEEKVEKPKEIIKISRKQAFLDKLKEK